jgi:hypothetical protein
MDPLLALTVSFPMVMSSLALLAIIRVLAVAAERSIRRQRGSKLRRGREERNAAGRVLEKYFRW